MICPVVDEDVIAEEAFSMLNVAFVGGRQWARSTTDAYPGGTVGSETWDKETGVVVETIAR